MVSESEPVCRTNVSHPRNAVNASDHIEIICNVSFKGIWTPVFVCDPDLPRTTIMHVNQTSSNHVLYRRIVAAAEIEDSAVFSCSMTFTLSPNYRTMVPEIPIKPNIPVYDFIWKTSAIRIVNISGKCRTRGQSNLTKSASRGAHSPVRGHPRGSKVVPLNSCGRVSY